MLCTLQYQVFLIISCLKLILYCYVTWTESLNVTTIVANIGSNITIWCSNTNGGLLWNFNDETIFSNVQFFPDHSPGNMSLDTNTYALQINPVGIKHQGKYTCHRKTGEKHVTMLFVEEPPVVIIRTKDREYRFSDDGINANPIYVDINERLTAECYTDSISDLNLTWTLNDKEIKQSVANVRYVKRGEFNCSRTTVKISTLLVREEGEISCIKSGLVDVLWHGFNITIPYNTYELPNLTLVFGEFNEETESLCVEQNQLVKVTCLSLGGRPPPTFSWLINGLNRTSSIEECKHREKTNEASSCVRYLPESSQDNVTCIAVLGNTTIEAKVEKKIHFYVSPNLTLMINEAEVHSNAVTIRDNDTVAICRVRGPSSEYELNWNFSDSFLEDFEEHKQNNEITLTFQPPLHSGNITCVYTGNGLCHVSKLVTLSTTGISDGFGLLQNQFFYPVLILTVVILIIMFVLTLRLKCHGSSNKDLTDSYSLQNQPMASRALPSINVNEGVVENVSNSFQGKFTAINNDYVTGAVSRCDVQLSCQLPGEGTMKYWLASATCGSKEDSKIIARTLSDNARMKEVMNFRLLAENLISLKTHENIVEVLGVAIDNVPYYIYQEYITCGSLKDYLLRNYQHSQGPAENETSPSQNDNKTIQLTALTVDICEGMLFLTNQRYRHPAITTRKVLLSSTGRCKLYDFWPADLANDRMKSILELKVPPLAWLAPECVFLGQYLEKSDVWNFGVVAWEVYSLGDTPFGGLTCSEIESKLRAKEDLSQPLTCPGGLFGVLLSTWNSSAEERPSFGDLQRKLTHFLTDMEQSFEEIRKKEEVPNYFTLSKDEDVDYDDYIES